MGRIVAQVKLENIFEPEKKMEFSALVDTGATYLTLPREWRPQLGELPMGNEVEMHTANGATVKGELCGPVRVRIDDFRELAAEVLFTEIGKSEDGNYEPLIGYIPLEQSCVAVDMLGHRLIKLKYFDLK